MCNTKIVNLKNDISILKSNEEKLKNKLYFFLIFRIQMKNINTKKNLISLKMNRMTQSWS